MRYVIVFLIIPLFAISQSEIEQKIIGVWEISQKRDKLIKTDKLKRMKFGLQFKEKGKFFYPNRVGFCGNEIPRIAEGKYMLRDSLLTIEFMQFGELKVKQLYVQEVTDEYLFLE